MILLVYGFYTTFCHGFGRWEQPENPEETYMNKGKNMQNFYCLINEFKLHLICVGIFAIEHNHFITFYAYYSHFHLHMHTLFSLFFHYAYLAVNKNHSQKM